MKYLSETPIVHDEYSVAKYGGKVGDVVSTMLARNIFRRGHHSFSRKHERKLLGAHKKLEAGRQRVPFSVANRRLRNIATQAHGGVNVPSYPEGGKQDVLRAVGQEDPATLKGRMPPREDENKMTTMKEGKKLKLNPQQRGQVVVDYRAIQKKKLQFPTHSSDVAPPIFPDPQIPMDPDLYEDKGKSRKQIRREKREEEERKAFLSGQERADAAIISIRKKAGYTGKDVTPLVSRIVSHVIHELAVPRPPESIRQPPERRGAPTSTRQTPERRKALVKRPSLAGRRVGHAKVFKPEAGLTGSDAYRPRSTHATLVRSDPSRFIEKMSALGLALRDPKTGKGRQVPRNPALGPKVGAAARKEFLRHQAQK